MKTLFTIFIGLGLLASSFAAPQAKPEKQPMLPHVYKIAPELFGSQLKKLLPPRKGESNQQLLLRATKKKHIRLPKGSSIELNENQGFIRIVTTREARLEFERLIAAVSEAK